MVSENYNGKNYFREISYREPIVRDRAITRERALGFGRATSYGSRYGARSYTTNNGNNNRAYRIAELPKGKYVDTGGSGGSALGAVPTSIVFA